MSTETGATPTAEAVIGSAAETAAAIAAETEPSIEQLLSQRAEPNGAEPAEVPPTGAQILAELSGSTPDEASAETSYGYDRELAETGKWFKWPKLGPEAFLLLRKVGCEQWRSVLEKARERYGEEDGTIKPKVMDKIIDALIAKGLWGGMRGVRTRVGEPALDDSIENRLRLLEGFHPDLGNDIFKVCASPKQFKDASEAILGN